VKVEPNLLILFSEAVHRTIHQTTWQTVRAVLQILFETLFYTLKGRGSNLTVRCDVWPAGRQPCNKWARRPMEYGQSQTTHSENMWSSPSLSALLASWCASTGYGTLPWAQHVCFWVHNSRVLISAADVNVQYNALQPYAPLASTAAHSTSCPRASYKSWNKRRLFS
jgi:hypothetical protein